MLIDSEDEDLEVKDYDSFNSYCDNFRGVIWGLYAAYYISEIQRDQLINDLLQASNRFYGIKEN